MAVSSQALLDEEAALKREAKTPQVAGAGRIVLVIFLSIASSVCIVMCNKEMYEHGFPFPLTAASVGYSFIWLFFSVMAKTGVWTPRSAPPQREKVKVAASSISSISFMNMCLLTNTVAIYQICKFMVIPCTLCIHKVVYNRTTNWRVLVSLVLVLGGVGYSSMKGFEAGSLGAKGIAFAVLAVTSTSVYRIWQETKQKEFKVSSIDLQGSMAREQAMLGLGAAMMTEFWSSQPDAQTFPAWLAGAMAEGFSPRVQMILGWMLGVCVAGLAVNFTSFLLIGKMGPIAYEVVGHAKTVLTISIGLVLFRGEETRATIRADIVGCAIALGGVVAYTYFEYCFKNNRPDWVEQRFPWMVAQRTATGDR